MGGKRWLLPTIEEHLPPGVIPCLHEPFVGGGALFWHLAHRGKIRKAVLSDGNRWLVRTYRAVRTDPQAVIRKFEDWKHRHEICAELAFEEARQLSPPRMNEGGPPSAPIDALSDAEVAAWFLYLCKASFNGLFRINGLGAVNSPFGKDDNGLPNRVGLDEARLLACHAALQLAEVYHQPLGAYVDQPTLFSRSPVRQLSTPTPEPGDVLFSDSPYYGTFDAYVPGGFNEVDHAWLARYLGEHADRGVCVVASNAEDPVVRRLYPVASGWQLHRVMRRGTVSSKGDGREPVAELLIVRHPPQGSGAVVPDPTAPTPPG